MDFSEQTVTIAENNHRVSFHDEMLIVVNPDNQVLDYLDKETCHRGEGILHRAFSIFIFNDKGEVLLQQRSAEKPLWPLIWSNSCCSHPRKGEDLQQSTARRLREELGIESELTYLYTFRYHARYKDIGSEREICAVFVGKSNQDVQVNPTEIADIEWVAADELTRRIKETPERFSPWMKMEWDRLQEDYSSEIAELVAGK